MSRVLPERLCVLLGPLAAGEGRARPAGVLPALHARGLHHGPAVRPHAAGPGVGLGQLDLRRLGSVNSVQCEHPT